MQHYYSIFKKKSSKTTHFSWYFSIYFQIFTKKLELFVQKVPTDQIRNILGLLKLIIWNFVKLAFNSEYFFVQNIISSVKNFSIPFPLPQYFHCKIPRIANWNTYTPRLDLKTEEGTRKSKNDYLNRKAILGKRLTCRYSLTKLYHHPANQYLSRYTCSI